MDKYWRGQNIFNVKDAHPKSILYTTGWFESGNNADLSETLSLTMETLLLNATHGKGTDHKTDVT